MTSVNDFWIKLKGNNLFWINYILYRNNQSQIWVNEEKSDTLHWRISAWRGWDNCWGRGGGDSFGGGVGVWEVGRLKWRISRKFSSWHFTQYSTSSPPFFLHFCFKFFRILISLIELKKFSQKKFSGNILILSQTEAGTFNSIHEINKTNYHTRHVKPILAL